MTPLKRSDYLKMIDELELALTYLDEEANPEAYQGIQYVQSILEKAVKSLKEHK